MRAKKLACIMPTFVVFAIQAASCRDFKSQKALQCVWLCSSNLNLTYGMLERDIVLEQIYLSIYTNTILVGHLEAFPRAAYMNSVAYIMNVILYNLT